MHHYEDLCVSRFFFCKHANVLKQWTNVCRPILPSVNQAQVSSSRKFWVETKSELTESLVPSRPSPRYYGVVKYGPYCTLTDENYVYVGNRVFLTLMYVVIIKAILVFLNTGVRHPSL